MTTILAPTAGVTIDADAQSRVFSVGAGVTANFTGLTITGGQLTGNGAGLYNRGATTLTDCVVAGNHAVGGLVFNGAGAIVAVHGGFGGAAFNLGGTLTLTNCTVSGNTADHAGGGAMSTSTPSVGSGKYSTAGLAATLTMTDCTVSENAAGVGSGVVNGLANASPATLLMTNCTVSANSALADFDPGLVPELAGVSGFGLVNLSAATLVNCTLWGNGGGGVFNTPKPSGVRTMV